MAVSWFLIAGQLLLEDLLGPSGACNDSWLKTQNQDLTKHMELA
jgi:hypothetical protein